VRDTANILAKLPQPRGLMPLASRQLDRLHAMVQSGLAAPNGPPHYLSPYNIATSALRCHALTFGFAPALTIHAFQRWWRSSGCEPACNFDPSRGVIGAQF
jgi:hypothetical protein